MAFKIIPVVDLKNGNVVHAVQGKRNLYKPLETLISNSIELNDLCSVFIKDYSFETIYIADLDAITNQGNQHDIIKSLLTTYPDLNVWLDSGLKFLYPININTKCTQILGTEMNFNLIEYQNLKQKFTNAILSLDYSGSDFLGDSQLLKYPNEWPKNIILMNLDKVGSQQGLNIERIKLIQSLLSDQQKLYIAGGIRDQSDLDTLDSLGIDGALISTSIHNKSITPSIVKTYT